MEPVAQLDKDFARVVPMESAKGLTIVEIHAPVDHVQSIERCGKALAEVFANREIERGVLRQMVSRIRLADESIAEAGTVIKVAGSKRPPRKSAVAANASKLGRSRDRSQGKHRP